MSDNITHTKVFAKTSPFQTIDSLIEYYIGWCDDHSPIGALKFILLYHKDELISTLKSPTNVSSKYDLMIITHLVEEMKLFVSADIGITEPKDYYFHQGIIKLYKNRKV